MNLRGIDLNLLPIFEAIYTERSLTRASEVLHVTQPALSNALVRLRRAFGDPLFIRSGRGMTPTPEAEQLIGPVRDAMARLRAGLDRAPASTRVRRNGRSTSRPARSPHLRSRRARASPRRRSAARAVLLPSDGPRGDSDGTRRAAARSGDRHRGARQADLESRPFLEDPYVCVLRRDHPSARRRLTIELLRSCRTSRCRVGAAAARSSTSR